MLKFTFVALLTVIRLNLGCGGRPLPDYINIDGDTSSQLASRYPSVDSNKFSDVICADIFNLPYESSTVDEIRADGLFEHLAFKEEPLLFRECYRVLRVGGVFNISVPDFEWVCKQWLSADDNWKDFYRNDIDSINSEHWFGNYSYTMTNRWGYLSAVIYGSQNGDGQYHKNCYSEKKLRSIADHIGFNSITIERFQWKDNRDHMLRLIAVK